MSSLVLTFQDLLHADKLITLYEKGGLKEQYDAAYLYLNSLVGKNLPVSKKKLKKLKDRLANELVNQLLLKAETTLLNEHYIEALISSTRSLTPENKKSYSIRLNNLAAYHVANNIIMRILLEMEHTEVPKINSKLDYIKNLIFKSFDNTGLFYKMQLLQSIEKIENL